MEQRSEGNEPRSKAEMRKRIRAWLPDDRRRASEQIVDRLLTVLEPGEGVLTFTPMSDEPDLADLGLHQFELALTRTPDRGWLTVHPWAAPREEHRWGFSQPVVDAPVFDVRWISTVLVPGVAFGRDGTRLGHGKGYYDELLSRIPHARKVGVGWECRMNPTVPTEPHDLTMDLVVTETDTYPGAHP